MDFLSALLSVSIFCAVYLLPSIIAEKRHHKNAPVITWVNLLLGWTGLFWLFCFFWSMTYQGDGSKA